MEASSGREGDNNGGPEGVGEAQGGAQQPEDTASAKVLRWVGRPECWWGEGAGGPLACGAALCSWRRRPWVHVPLPSGCEGPGQDPRAPPPQVTSQQLCSSGSAACSHLGGASAWNILENPCMPHELFASPGTCAECSGSQRKRTLPGEGRGQEGFLEEAAALELGGGGRPHRGRQGAGLRRGASAGRLRLPGGDGRAWRAWSREVGGG